MKKMGVRIFDNEGITLDRYTVIIDQDVYSMSRNAMSGQGVNTFNCTLGYPVNQIRIDLYDKEVDYWSLPDEVRHAIIQRMGGGE
jgi:hypothetical protein